jgi:hypothetical protein
MYHTVGFTATTNIVWKTAIILGTQKNKVVFHTLMSIYFNYIYMLRLCVNTLNGKYKYIS